MPKKAKVDVQALIAKALEAKIDREDEMWRILDQEDISEEAKEAVINALRILARFRDEIPEERLAELAALAGVAIPEEEVEERRTGEIEEEVEIKLRDDLLTPKLKSDGSFDLSGVPKAQRKMVEALWKNAMRAEKLEKQLKEERDARILKEFIAKAEELDHIPMSAEELGALLKLLAERLPDEYDKIEDLLEAINEMLAAGSVFKEIGTTQRGASSAWAKIEQMASSMIQKDAKVTKEQAIAKVLEDNPELYAEYLKEGK